MTERGSSPSAAWWGWTPAVVLAGQDRVRGPFFVGDVAEPEGAREDVVIPEQLVQLLARERQERREEDLEAVDATQSDVEDRRGAVPVGFDHRPRRLLR